MFKNKDITTKNLEEDVKNICVELAKKIKSKDIENNLTLRCLNLSVCLGVIDI